jgi:deazaflavin-dependent oxidoreductase (nitroreductase family)
MTYVKPAWIVKTFSGLMARANVAERLTVTGRVSGEPRRVAVTSVDVDGVKYLVSTRGESEWVRNVRANPSVILAVKGESTAYFATELPAQQRPPIISAFKPLIPIVGRYFVMLPDPADHPVFALSPTPAAGP